MRKNKFFGFLFLGLLGSSAVPAQNYIPGYTICSSTAKTTVTMIFDTHCQVKYDFDAHLRKVVLGKK